VLVHDGISFQLFINSFYIVVLLIQNILLYCHVTEVIQLIILQKQNR